jgi:hypothetical protein
MQRFTIETPGGRRLTIEAPDEATAMRGAQEWHASQQQPKVVGDAAPMGTDGVSGEGLRASAAGDTRSQMRPEDIRFAYQTAQDRGDAGERKAMADAFVARETADNPVSMTAGNAVRSVARGVPVLGGLADEANALTSGISGLMPGGRGFAKSAEERLDYERARDRAFDKSNPISSMALQLAGGVGSGVGIAAGIAPRLSNMGRIAATGTGLAGGATLGAVDGATRGEDMTDRAAQAAIGGVIGGAVGAAAPAIAKGAGEAVSRVSQALSTSRDLRGLGLSRGAANVIDRSMMADGSLGGIGQGRIAAAGSQGMLADAGPSSAGLLDAVIQQGGPGAVAAREAVEGRVTAASGQIGNALDNALGQPQGVTATQSAIRTQAKPGVASAYDTAYSTPIDYAAPAARDLEAMVARVPSSVISRANNLMAIEGNASRQIMADIADNGRVTFRQMPDVRQIDYITRALNDVAKAGDGQGALGGMTAEGRAYGNLARDLRNVTGDLVPAYREALDTASDPIRQINAVELGQRLISPSTTRDEAAELLRGMGTAEREAVKQGVRSQIDDAMSNISRIASDPNIDAREAAKGLRDLSSRSSREKVALVIGGDEAAALFNQLDEAARAFELRANVATNSKTATRQIARDNIADMNAPGPIGTLAEGRPMEAGRRILQGALGTGPQARVGRDDQIYSELAQALTGPRGPDAVNYARSVEDILRRRQQLGQAGQAFGVITSGGLSGLALSGGRQAIAPPPNRQR